MRRRIPGAAKALIALTATGLLLGGCHAYHRAHHGKPYYAAPGHHGHPHHAKHRKHGHGHGPGGHHHRRPGPS